MHRGEVWLINLDPTVGAEIRKVRPAVIVNDDAVGILPLRVIVPITEWKDKYSVAPWMVRLVPDAENGLDNLSGADTFQVRSLSQARFVQQLGKLSEAAMQEITKALAVVLAIEWYQHFCFIQGELVRQITQAKRLSSKCFALFWPDYVSVNARLTKYGGYYGYFNSYTRGCSPSDRIHVEGCS